MFKQYLLLFLAAQCFFSCQGVSQTQPELRERKTASDATRDRSAYDSLHVLLSGHYTQLSATERKALRIMLKEQAVWPYETLYPESEPGIRITLHGQVTDEKQQPVPGAHLHIFQTDSHGYYSPLDSASGRMLENDPRLEGFLISDSLGRFEINTIRPASYPIKYEGRSIPQHIHANIKANGFHDGIFQIVFEDDPAMLTEHWKTWAQNGQHPIVKLIDNGNRKQGSVALTLHR